MAEYKDLLLDDDNKLRIADGDFVVGQCEDQNAKLLLLSEKGSHRADPLMGVGLRRALNAKLTGGFVLSLRRNILGQFTADGSRVTELSITPVKFYLSSERI